uniref:Uncharacterized protein n=1 Tax=Magallana gigas TaxID=29159 RepID=A0A8W8JTI8_MAGGI
MKNCYGDTPDYLCAAIENMLGQYGEICTKKRWIPENKCAVLNAQTHNLDSVDCKADIGCPPNMILSSEVWRLLFCFRTTPSQIETKVQGMTTSIVMEQESVSGGFWLIIVVIMATLIGSLLVVFIFDKKFNWRLLDRFRSRVREIQEDETESPFLGSEG